MGFCSCRTLRTLGLFLLLLSYSLFSFFGHRSEPVATLIEFKQNDKNDSSPSSTDSDFEFIQNVEAYNEFIASYYGREVSRETNRRRWGEWREL